MKNKLIPILLLIFTFVANAQIYDGTLVEDSKGRFIGDIKVLGNMNRATIDAVDKTGLLNEFTLKMKVWDYLGEPLEMYAFQWFRKETYRVQVDNTTRSIRLDQLKEYPDLQKRFLDLRPTKVDIKISGSASKISVEESSVPINVNYTYIVKDADLLIAREGAFREPTVAGSPPTWNEFFDWQYPEPTGQLINLNVSEASFKRLSVAEQKQRIKKIKNIWKQVKQLNVNASIIKLKWPEYEMIDIIKTYDRYKNKKKELSPQEILDAELAKVRRTTEYNQNDDWGELPELKEEFPKIGIDKSLITRGENFIYEYQFVFTESEELVNVFDKLYNELNKRYSQENHTEKFNAIFEAYQVIDNRILVFEIRSNYNIDDGFLLYDLKTEKLINNSSEFYHICEFVKKVLPNGDVAWLRYDGFDDEDHIYNNIYSNNGAYSTNPSLIEKYFTKGKTHYIINYDDNLLNEQYHIYNENFEYLGKFYLYSSYNKNLMKETKITKSERVAHYRKVKQ